jgi:hypothetical protein
LLVRPQESHGLVLVVKTRQDRIAIRVTNLDLVSIHGAGECIFLVGLHKGDGVVDCRGLMRLAVQYEDDDPLDSPQNGTGQIVKKNIEFSSELPQQSTGKHLALALLKSLKRRHLAFEFAIWGLLIKSRVNPALLKGFHHGFTRHVDYGKAQRLQLRYRA